MEFETPCFVFDKEIFTENIDSFYRELNFFFPDVVIGYSFKTNNLPVVLSSALDLGCYAEVVSDTEYELAKRIGYPADRIIFNGPIKGKAFLEKAYRNDSIINVDSWNEIEYISEISEKRKMGVGLRVNIDIESYIPGQGVAGEEGGRFGFNYENGELHKVINVCHRNGVSIKGLHMHVSSRSKLPLVYKLLAEMAVQIVEEESLSITYIDIGGGFFGGNDNGMAYKEYASIISEALRPLKRIRLIVEPGASLVATAFSYIVTVEECKMTNKSRFVVTDGTRIHIDPFFTKNNYDYSYLIPEDDNIRKTVNCQIICGYTCMENDRIMRIFEGMELERGDQIVFNTVGSYTLGFNSMFIRFLPRVYMKENLMYTVVRNEWKVDDFLHSNIW